MVKRPGENTVYIHAGGVELDVNTVYTIYTYTKILAYNKQGSPQAEIRHSHGLGRSSLWTHQ